jgi:hypothetical protein
MDVDAAKKKKKKVFVFCVDFGTDGQTDQLAGTLLMQTSA